MMPSRGMGDIRASKMPKAKVGKRKDGDKFPTQRTSIPRSWGWQVKLGKVWEEYRKKNFLKI
jgi:hypothetical protein